jgi:class 3 adenylate cyclase
MTREFLEHHEGHALRVIGDGLLVGPPGCRDARAQRLEFPSGTLGIVNGLIAVASTGFPVVAAMRISSV